MLVHPRLRPVLAVCALGLTSAPALGQQVIYVDADAAPGGNGLSWAGAFTTIQEALDLAWQTPATIDDIWVAEGRYVPTQNLGPEFRFNNVANVRLLGGFAGSETSSNQRSPATYRAVLDADRLGNDVIVGSQIVGIEDNSSILMSSQNAVEMASLVISGFQIEGTLSGIHSAVFQGAVVLESLEIAECPTFRFPGFADAPSPPGIIRDCLVRDCESVVLFTASSNYRATNISFERCIAEFVFNSVWQNVRITDCVLPQGSRTLITLNGASLSNVLVANNSASWSDGDRFKMIESVGSCSIANSIFWNNQAPAVGEIVLRPGNLTVVRSLFDAGLPPLWDQGGTISVVGTILSGNPGFVSPLGPDGQPGTGDEDYRLGPGSLCIDAGDNNAIPFDLADIDGDGITLEPLPLDLDLGSRRADVGSAPDTGVGPAPIVDIGPYEVPACQDCPGERAWQNASGGAFSTPANWFPGVAGIGNTAVFDLPNATYTVDFSGIVRTFELRIRSGEPTFDLSGASYELLSTSTTPVIIGEDPGEIGFLTIANGPMRSQRGILAQSPGSVGDLRITGPGSEWFVDQELRIGDGGQSTATIDAGGLLDVLDLSLGGLSGARGDLIVDGPGSIVRSVFGIELVNGSIELRNGGTLELGFPGFQSELSIRSGGALTGRGDITGTNILNLGSVAPSPAPPGARAASPSLTIDGNFVQLADLPRRPDEAGSLTITLTGAPEAPDVGLLTVNGAATLGGGLILVGDLDGGASLDPGAAQNLPILDATSINGRFDVALLPSLAGGASFLSLEYGGLQRGADRAGIAVALQVNSLTGNVELDPAPAEDTGEAGVPTDAVLADIDGDGDPDLLVTLPDATNPTIDPGSVVILYNADDGNAGNGWEGFTGGTRVVSTGVGVNPSAIDVGFLDADATLDIAIANRGTPGNPGADTVSVLLISDGTQATFTIGDTRSILVQNEPRDIAIDDLDNDGAADILVPNAGSDSVSIAFGSSAGVGPGWVGIDELKKIDLPQDDDTPLSARPGDTNADLFSFIATANSGSHTVTVVRVHPDRTLQITGSYPVGEEPVEILVLNIDSDLANPNDSDDIITVNRAGNSISVARNTTSGVSLTFAPPVQLPVGASTILPSSIAAGDFDADANGDTDLAVLADGVVKVFRNDLFSGDLAFTPLPDEPAGAAPLLVRSADLNADVRDDVVTIAESAGALLLRAAARSGMENVNTLLGGSSPPPPLCAGDINVTGDTNAADFVIFAGNFGASVTPNTGGDLNGDGLVNASDFVILAGDFGCSTPASRGPEPRHRDAFSPQPR